jgi:hypothetical protein
MQRARGPSHNNLVLELRLLQYLLVWEKKKKKKKKCGDGHLRCLGMGGGMR